MITSYRCIIHAGIPGNIGRDLDRLVVDAALNQQARRGVARLTGIVEAETGGPFHCFFQVSVREYETWGFSAKFQGNALDGGAAA